MFYKHDYFKICSFSRYAVKNMKKISERVNRFRLLCKQDEVSHNTRNRMLSNNELKVKNLYYIFMQTKKKMRKERYFIFF